MTVLKRAALASAIWFGSLASFSEALVGQHPQISFAIDFVPAMPVSKDLKNLWVVVEAWPEKNESNKARNQRVADELVGSIVKIIGQWAAHREIKVLKIERDTLDQMRSAIKEQAEKDGKDVRASLSSMEMPDAYIKLSVRADARVEDADTNALGRMGITKSKISKVLVECNAECVAMNGVVHGTYKEVLETREFAEVGLVDGKPEADMGSPEGRMQDIAWRHGCRLVSNMIGVKAQWQLDLPGLSGDAALAKSALEKGDFGQAMRIGVFQWQKSIAPGSGVAPDFNAAIIAEIAYFGMGQVVQAESLDSAIRAKASELRLEVSQPGDIMWICRDPRIGRVASSSFPMPSNSMRP